VCRFGYIGNLVIEPTDIHTIQHNLDNTKQSVVVTQTAYFHLFCHDVAEMKRQFESPVALQLFEEYHEACVGTAASLNLRDIVRIHGLSTATGPAREITPL
jgi:hypothetical protein